MKRPETGRGLFYTRDSGGKHEQTPPQYVEWAQQKCKQLSVSFSGTADQINGMIRNGLSVEGDLFLDFAVTGNVLSRPGLNGLIDEAKKDSNVSHILIPRRDRLARPNDPIDAMKIENLLRESGITLVFADKVLLPRIRGKRPDISEQITAIIEYDHAGEDRRKLAEKILPAQLELAKAGYSTGGRPPFAFRRWLVKTDGVLVRELAEGERVRMREHHVVWMPGPENEIALVMRILEMLESTPAARVAAQLTAEGIPSPDAGRYRRDHGVRHQVSGVWSQTTITCIARNPLLMALCTYGRRSMGDQLRYNPTGPRILKDSDFRADLKPKVVRNAESELTIAKAGFEPLVNPQRHNQLLESLDRRGGSQRGKPRSTTPGQNPLGCRVFDMACGWPMYREPYSGSFRYKCGLYQQSHGQKCNHNHIDGMTATRFVLSSLRQRFFAPRVLESLKKRLRALALGESMNGQRDPGLLEKKAALSRLETDLARINRNLALAETEDQFKAVSQVFDETKRQHSDLQAEIATLESRPEPTNSDAEVQKALSLLDKLTNLATEGKNLNAAREICEITNTRLFFQFQPTRVKKRTVNKLVGGVLTAGSAPPPVTLYNGQTSRRKLKSPAADEPTATPGSENSGREGSSLGNVSRGDWI